MLRIKEPCPFCLCGMFVAMVPGTLLVTVTVFRDKKVHVAMMNHTNEGELGNVEKIKESLKAWGDFKAPG